MFWSLLLACAPEAAVPETVELGSVSLAPEPPALPPAQLVDDDTGEVGDTGDVAP